MNRQKTKRGKYETLAKDFDCLLGWRGIVGVGLLCQLSADLGGCVRLSFNGFNSYRQHFDGLDAKGIMAFWFAPVGAAIGGAVGKVLGKISEWIPSRDQYNRTKIERLKKERDEIIQDGIPADKRLRLERVLAELHAAEQDLQAR